MGSKLSHSKIMEAAEKIIREDCHQRGNVREEAIRRVLKEDLEGFWKAMETKQSHLADGENESLEGPLTREQQLIYDIKLMFGSNLLAHETARQTGPVQEGQFLGVLVSKALRLLEEYRRSGSSISIDEARNISVNLNRCNVKPNDYITHLYCLCAVLESLQMNDKKGPVMDTNLNRMADIYFISNELRQLACQVVALGYGTFDACLDSNNAVNMYLYLALASQMCSFLENVFGWLLWDELAPYVKKVFAIPPPQTWLRRNRLHWIAILFRDAGVLGHIQDNVIQADINAGDIHNCTPLHLAYLHNNTTVIHYLKSKGARDDLKDNFGFDPESLDSRFSKIESAGDIRREHCVRVMQGKANVSRLIKEMVVLPDPKNADVIAQQLRTIFERALKIATLVDVSLQNSHLNIGEETALGSLVKELGEVARATELKDVISNVLIGGSVRERLKVEVFNEVDIQIRCSKLSGMTHVCLTTLLLKAIITAFNLIEWQDIQLRPICIINPFEFLWEAPGPMQGLRISVDVVLIMEESHSDQITSDMQGLILKEPRKHKVTHVSYLSYGGSFPTLTCCAYEWDILDSLPTGCRVGIMVAKSLLRAYYTTSKYFQTAFDLLVSTYMLKTALFDILSEQEDKLEYEPNPRWLTSEEYDTHCEEGRIWAERIFKKIKSGVNKHGFWSLLPEAPVMGPEVEEICDSLLQRLTPDVYY